MNCLLRLQVHPAIARLSAWTALSLVLLSTPAQAQDAAKPPADEEPASVQNSALTAPLFYQLLLGELNVRGGEPGAGYSLILDAARRQRDPLLYRRSVEVALQARSGEAALSAARAWAQDIPGSLEADRYVLQILLALNRVAETAPVLRDLLRDTAENDRNDTLNAIPQTYARVMDKALAAQVVREALAPLLARPEHAAPAWTTIGRMELAQGRLPQAQEAALTGHAADPTSPYPALLALELLERGATEMEPMIRRQIQASQKASDMDTAVALNYARILLDLQRLGEARQQLEGLTTRQPLQPEPWLLLGSLQAQTNDLRDAAASLSQYMALVRQSPDERGARGLTQAYLLQAQIAEKQGDYATANAWLDRIENADEIMAAQMRRASLLARQGRLDQARELLRQQPERRPEDARLKLVAEAQLLRDFKQWAQAYEVYGEAVRRFPDDNELLYDQAMMAEKANRPAEMEALLRRLMAARPDHQHAYNALGYYLADRGERLLEAKQLIEKAVSLAPDDAYIQDSLGWVEFRMGNTDKALAILRAAYAKRADAEIAAHLGEVLWTAGQRDQALKIWREGLILAADNETLVNTLKRLKVQP